MGSVRKRTKWNVAFRWLLYSWREAMTIKHIWADKTPKELNSSWKLRNLFRIDKWREILHTLMAKHTTCTWKESGKVWRAACRVSLPADWMLQPTPTHIQTEQWQSDIGEKNVEHTKHCVTGSLKNTAWHIHVYTRWHTVCRLGYPSVIYISLFYTIKSLYRNSLWDRISL